MLAGVTRGGLREVWEVVAGDHYNFFQLVSFLSERQGMGQRVAIPLRAVQVPIVVD